MRRQVSMLALAWFMATHFSVGIADDDVPSPAPPLNPARQKQAVPVTRTPKPARPTQAQPATAVPVAAVEDQAAAAADTPKFVAEDKWLIAGYNNDEVIYQVFITNQDTRIIRCTTEIHGFYFDNGIKQSISDRQITTVFPNQPTQAGTWLDMDQQSGATYSVRCHPI